MYYINFITRMKNKKLIAATLIILLAAIVGYFILTAKSTNGENKIVNIFNFSEEKIAAPEDKNIISVSQEASIIFVGDIILSRSVAKKIKAKKDINYPFLKMKDYLNGVDLVFGNLENPITDGPEVKTGSMVFHADPGIEQALKNANISIVSLANNHTPNYGKKGLLDTFDYLKKADIKYAGAGKNDIEADKPTIFEIQGIKFAFLAYNDSDVIPASYGAGANRAGTNLMSIKKLTEAVKKAKSQADLVIISMHSGKEYTENINDSQKKFARAAIDAGAELVIGHHPHVVQRVEKYKDKYIFYSLGNFIFDQMWSEDTKKGIAAKIFFNKTGVGKIEITPIKIEDYSQPKILIGQEVPGLMNRLKLGKDEKIKIVN